MARPLKDGIDYFPLDVDYLNDKKVRLIKAEFGPMGVLVFLQVLAEIYRNNGYYMVWDGKEDSLLMADSIACGCTADLVAEIVQGCVRRSIFDSGVANVFGVLTSPGIQRRYLRAVAERSNIYLIKEYFLLDMSNKKDIPMGISKKITFKTINPQINSVNLQINQVDLPINPQSKVKKSKEEKSKVKNINMPGGFDIFWDAYPKKVAKGAAETSWKKINPSEQLMQEMLTAISKAKQSQQWLKDNGQYIPNPSTWLNQKRWEDQLKPEIPKQSAPIKYESRRMVKRGNKNWEGIE